MAEKNSTKTWIIVAVVVLIVAGGAWYYFGGSEPAETPAASAPAGN